MADFWVNGIVSQRDKQPYIQLSNENGMIAQLSMGQARQIAQDIVITASRCEMDAMVLAFLSQMEIPGDTEKQAAVVMMREFRDFRARLDAEKVERSMDEGRGGDGTGG